MTRGRSTALGALLLLLGVALCCQGGGCTESEQQEQELVALEGEVSKGVSQYVTLVCDCFGVEDEAWQTICQQEQSLQFPTSACDAEMLRLDEVSGSSFLFCLQRDVNRASACLIGCDASLIRQCQSTFWRVDTGECQSLLSPAQLEALQICQRTRERERRGLVQ